MTRRQPLVSPGSFEFLYFAGLKHIKAGNTGKAVVDFRTLMARDNLNDREYAVAASTLSDIYIKNRQDR